MHSKFTYLLIDIATIIVPFVFSFHPKINFYKTWKAFWPANLIIALVFILWDIFYTHIGVWGFNDNYTCGLKLFNLPIEEVLFFVCIPYASIFTYHCLKLYLKNKKVDIKYVSIFLSLSLLVIGLINISNLYTSVTFITLGIFIIFLKFINNANWLYTFYLCYLVILLPFFIVNGILTGSWINEPIVWYNNQQNLQIRLLTIPVEDVFYGMLLLILNTWLYERFSKKKS